MSHIIAVANQKGGVGKTTTAINIAAYLSKMGKHVLLIDLDPQGNSTSGLGIDKDSLKYTTYDVLMGSVVIEQAIIKSDYANLDILPTSPVLAAAEVELAHRPKREFVLKSSLLSAALGKYDYIFIDCPPSLGLLTINGLVGSGMLLIPAQAEYYALEGLGQLLNTVKRVRAALNPHLKLLGVVVTMFDSRTSLSGAVIKELEKHFGDLVFDTTIPRNIRLAEAPSHGKPIFAYDRFCRGAFAYKKLTREVSSRVERAK
ncbi:MAG: AAA family ATPase [Candidatus Saccharibacteria bacterium]